MVQECNNCSIKQDLIDCFNALKEANNEIDRLLADSLTRKLTLEKKCRQIMQLKGAETEISTEDFYLRKYKCSEESQREAEEQKRAITERTIERYRGKRVLFVLPLGIVTGGGNVVVSEAVALRKFGIDACILNLQSEKETYNRNYSKYEVPTFFVDDYAETIDICESFDVVCATSWQTIYVADFSELSKRVRVAYYVQDYEPYFYDDPNDDMYKFAKASYSLVDNIKIVTKTRWNQETLHKELGVESSLLAPSVNTDSFFVTNSEKHDKLRITALVRPQSPRRAPELTMRVLKKIYDLYGDNIEIHIFGNSFSGDSRFFIDNETDFEFVNHELTDSQKTASILASSDIFVDFSSYQAMGLTGLEAMLCGCAVILPENGGATSYAVNDVNSRVIDTTDEKECFRALSELITNRELRERLSLKAIQDANQYYPERAAELLASAIFD